MTTNPLFSELPNQISA